MLVDLKKCKINKTYKTKDGKVRNIISHCLIIGNTRVFIKPCFDDGYPLLDSFSDFVDLTKKEEKD